MRLTVIVPPALPIYRLVTVVGATTAFATNFAGDNAATVATVARMTFRPSFTPSFQSPGLAEPSVAVVAELTDVR